MKSRALIPNVYAGISGDKSALGWYGSNGAFVTFSVAGIALLRSCF